MAADTWGAAEDHARRTVKRSPNHENKELLNTFGGEAGVETPSAGLRPAISQERAKQR